MMKTTFTLRALSFPVFACAFMLLAAAPSNALVRSWVSATGNDANSCSRRFPCRTFAAALAVTDVNGEINVIDPGSYGALEITKSVTIDATGTFAGVQVGIGTTGISINITDAADTKKTVRLRGLSISTTDNQLRFIGRGIRVQSALAVHVEDCVIDGFRHDGIEVNVAAPAATELHVRNTVIRNCVPTGVSLTATNNKGVVLATFDNTEFLDNRTGLDANSRSRALMRNCTVSASTTAGITVGGTADVVVEVVESILTYNPSAVLVNLGTARVAQCLIFGNTNGLNRVAGTLETYSNNQLNGNISNTVGTITPVLEN